MPPTPLTVRASTSDLNFSVPSANPLFALTFTFSNISNLFSCFSVNNLSTVSSYLLWEIMRLH